MAIYEKIRRDGLREHVLDFRDQKNRRIRERLVGKTKNEAKAKYLERLGEVSAGTYRHPTLDAPVPDPAPPLTLAKFIEDTFKPGYAALRSSDYYTNICLPIVRHMGEVPIAEIDGARISDYVTLRSTEAVSAATIRKELGALGTILRHARLHRKVSLEQIEDFGNVQKPPRPRPRGNYLTTADVAKLLMACEATPWVARMAKFMMLTGLDRGEVCALRWDAIDETAGLLRAPRAKTGILRTLPLTATLKAIVDDCRKARTVHGAGYVFLGPDGHPVTPNAFHLGICRAYRRAGLAPRQPTKVFRHVFRTLGRLAGIDSGIVAALMGHAAGITEGYGALPLETLADAMARMDERLGRDLDAERTKGVSIPPRNKGGRPKKACLSRT